MNYYEWIKNLSMDEMAAVLTSIEMKTYNESREKLAPILPEMKSDDYIKLTLANLEMLKQEVADEEPKAEQKIKRSECEGIDCAWCGEDCK